jgi:hypothetical protein
MSSLWSDPSFTSGLWQGVFQLLSLGIVAFFGNIIYRRYRERDTARQDLLNEIDQFTVALYKPRKVYQGMLSTDPDLLAGMADPQRQIRRIEIIEESLEELTAVTGRFRSLQVNIVPLYGYHEELFSYYLAIWRYLKEIRRRMERRENLYFHHESPESVDAFYRLIDEFRYRVMVARFVPRPPTRGRPPGEFLDRMHERGRAIYQGYFGGPAAARPDGPSITASDGATTLAS